MRIKALAASWIFSFPLIACGGPAENPAGPDHPVASGLSVMEPQTGTLFTAADDVDPGLPGLQVRLRIEVRDPAITAVTLFHADTGSEERIPVKKGVDGKRVALAQGITATTGPLPRGQDNTVQASGLDALGESIGELTLQFAAAHSSQGPVEGCQSLTTVQSDTALAIGQELSNLDGEGCLLIRGDLRITGTELAAFEALSELVFVDGHLQIDNNLHLKSLTALHGLRGIGGDLIIVDNPNLPTEEINDFIAAVGEDRIHGAIRVGENPTD
jgi:hypothetical protein